MSNEECGRHDAFQSVAREEDGGAPSEGVRLHHLRVEHHSTSQEAGGLQPKDDLHRLRIWIKGLPSIRSHHETCPCDKGRSVRRDFLVGLGQ